MNSNATWHRVPAIISFPDTTGYTETYGFAGTSGRVNLEGQYFIPANRPSKTLFIFMHPSSTLNLMPMPAALAAAGLHVLCAASRYPKNDSSLIMEKVLIDLGAWIRESREQRGYEKIVLVGWSGGGSLSLFYQAQAEKPTIKTTPAGDALDLSAAGLLPANGVIFIAAHLSRAETLTEWLDPSVLDERDPDRRDREFDIYDESCPNKPPFCADFVARFRAAQRARSRRITDWCFETLAELRHRGGPEIERAFIVQRTMCDVRWIDATVDPNGRRPNWCYLGDPRTVNVAPVGLARYTSLRSWLSQWSYDASQAKAEINAPLVTRTPVLQIENLADDAVPATHNPTVSRLLGARDKTYIRIDKATHYYVGQPEQLGECIRAVIGWCEERGLLQ